MRGFFLSPNGNIRSSGVLEAGSVGGLWYGRNRLVTRRRGFELSQDPVAGSARGQTCRHCGRSIVNQGEGLYAWIDPEATGGDAIWREACDSHDTFTAEHEPEEGRAQ